MTSEARRPHPLLFSPRLLVPLLLFGACFFLYTRHNEFPFVYHPDESTKVQMVRKDYNKFYHPLLLMTPTRFIAWALDIKGWEDVPKLGRTVSAVFGSLAVVAFCLLGWRRGGLFGGLAVGLPVGLSHSLFTYSHYFKEDTALVVGIAWTLWALGEFLHARKGWSVFALGLGAALAVSGKYVGVVAPVMAFAFLMAAPLASDRDRRWRRAMLFFGPFLAVVIAINYDIVVEAAQFHEGLAAETRHVSTHHKGLIYTPSPVVNAYILSRETILPVLLLGVGYGLFALGTRLRAGWRRWRGRTSAHDADTVDAARWRPPPTIDATLAGFALGFTGMLCFSSLQSGRYMLPVTVTVSALAGLALVELRQRWRERGGFGNKVCPALLAVIVLWQSVVTGIYYTQFASDSRDRVAAWIPEHLPKGSRIAQDTMGGLGTVKVQSGRVVAYSIPVDRVGHLGDAGSPEELARKGYTHALACSMNYGRFFSVFVRPIEKFSPWYDETRRNYSRLFSECELLWESEPLIDMQAFTNPTIRLYRLPAGNAGEGGDAGATGNGTG